MSLNLNVDEILNKLSTKFNKIFYDREFVCCVNQDLQVVLENKNSCCVVVFPVLGPNYLKAVRYQAKIFDLAVITLGTGRNRAVAVCQKEFIKKNSNEVTETAKVQIMPQSSLETSSSKLRKKRPERQLYVPPAQRRLPSNPEDIPYSSEKCHNVKNEDVINTKKESCSRIANRNVLKECDKHPKLRSKCSAETKSRRESKEAQELLNNGNCRIIESESEKRACLDYLFSINYICILWRYRVDKSDPFAAQDCFKSTTPTFREQLLLYNRQNRSNILYILHKNCVLWQPQFNICSTCDNVSCGCSRVYPLCDFKEVPLISSESELQRRSSILSDCRNDELKVNCKNVSRNFDHLEYTAFKIIWDENRCISESDVVVDLSVINCGHNFIINSENGSDFFYECNEVHDITKCYLDKKKDVCDRNVYSSKDEISLPIDQKVAPLIESSVIVLGDTAPTEIPDQSNLTVKTNNDKNTSTNINVTRYDLINNVTNEIIKAPKKSSEHEQEKEIMRKTKEHINRKSRPIMKYVDDNGDMLKIGKNDNVNNWEELFDDEGQLQDDLFKEVVHKVGSDVTILKAQEDYSDYVTKQSEELEHMVELYDFPPTLETHDVIQTFSGINSEAMYVKWVDDTHAILVLGSLTQAQKAIELDNPLIKVRPMTAASGVSLAAAYKHDLKPAMKRPQTNLQTARRLITTHLGTKSRISNEQNAKERNDLKVAREMKKLTKKNEQDAWEGNLRSAIH